jgi:hypothetical protein
MKNWKAGKKFFVCFLMLLVIIFAWCSRWKHRINEQNDYEELVSQAQKNDDLRIYKLNIPIYKQLIQQEPDNKQWYSKYLEACRQMGDEDSVEQIAQWIYAKWPDDSENVSLLMECYIEDGNTDKLMALFESLSLELQQNIDLKQKYEDYVYGVSIVRTLYGTPVEIGRTAFIEQVESGMVFMAQNGNELYREKSFGTAHCFYSGEKMAAVRTDGEWYFIDEDGDRILATHDAVEDLYSMDEGYAVIGMNGLYGFVDAGFEKYHMEYEAATTLYNGVAAVKKNGKWGLLNSSLEPVTDFIYEDIIIGSDNVCSKYGLIFAKESDGYHMLDLTGTPVGVETYEDARLFGSDGIAAVKKNGKWGFVDTQGNQVLDYQYEDADSFSKGLAPICINGVYEYIDKNGIIRTELQAQKAYPLSGDGYGIVKIEEQWKIITFRLYQ